MMNYDVKRIQNSAGRRAVIIDSVYKMWPHFNRKTYDRILSTRKNLLSVAMLSLIRTEKLLKMMQHWGEHRYTTANLALRVQAKERVTKAQKELIKTVSKKAFDKTHIVYTAGNQGTGVPRNEMVHKALDFETPYVMTTDDDMFFPQGSIELLIAILEDNPELGAVDLYCQPNLNAWEIGDKAMHYRPPRRGLDYVDAMGSATMVMRREVFEKCDYDRKYFIGWADIDFCVQMRKAGWKLAILRLNGFEALNDKGGNPKEYKKIRYGVEYARKSAARFREKWGLFI